MNGTPSAENRIRESLAKVPSFSTLDERSRRKLAKLCALRTFEAGDVIFEEGAIGLSVFVVTSGQAERYKSRDGTKVSLGSVEAGGVLGEVALLDDRPRSTSAAALEPTECLLLTRDSLETLIKKEPRIAWCLVPALAGRVRDLQGLAVETELESMKRNGDGAIANRAEPSKMRANGKEVEPHDPHEVFEAWDEARTEANDAANDEASDPAGGRDAARLAEPESALFKVMRMQFGLVAGGAKGMIEMAKMMESLVDSLAQETDLNSGKTWRDMLEIAPNAMVTATRKAMGNSNKAAQAIVEAFRRHQANKE